MAYAFPPAWIPTLPIRSSSDEFPVRRIYCVGRNYAEHAVEMGHDPEKDPPFFFQKNPDNLVQTGEFPYPGATKDVHHEIELVVALSKGGTDIAASEALDHVFGYAVGLDMTRRDLQAGAKKLGRPWEIAKAFEKSAPISEIVQASAIGHPSSGAISLAINGESRQSGDLSQMIWKTGEIIAHLSGLFELAPGDLIMTGTPSGVGAVKRGDRLEGAVEGVGTLVVMVV